ncbi:MAG: hypothetical protein M2R45_01548 [Verrucomicrobia subdivision 3 bacterium]|nr:hypothetical protein [Limisphaerales bacterium]MCS1413324.1 hypothetical protein [Limisphaerales bacterium]
MAFLSIQASMRLTARLIMYGNGPPIAADHRHERHRFRGRERHVAARPVLDVTAGAAAPELASA